MVFVISLPDKSQSLLVWEPWETKIVCFFKAHIFWIYLKTRLVSKKKSDKLLNLCQSSAFQVTGILTSFQTVVKKGQNIEYNLYNDTRGLLF